MNLPLRVRLLLRRREKHRDRPGPLAFRARGSGLTRVLIIIPEQPDEYRTAHYFLKSVIAAEKISATLLAPAGFSYDATFRDRAPLQTYDRSDFDWWGRPNRAILERLCSPRPDAVLDLNPRFNLSAALLTLYSDAPLRVGFKSDFSHRFYNLELDSRPETFLEQSYINLQKLLGL